MATGKHVSCFRQGGGPDQKTERLMDVSVSRAGGVHGNPERARLCFTNWVYPAEQPENMIRWRRHPPPRKHSYAGGGTRMGAVAKR